MTFYFTNIISFIFNRVVTQKILMDGNDGEGISLSIIVFWTKCEGHISH